MNGIAVRDRRDHLLSWNKVRLLFEIRDPMTAFPVSGILSGLHPVDSELPA
jgi:hypothetical protein